MNASIPMLTRINLRDLTTFFLIVVGFLLCLPLATAHAAEKKFLGDVIVGPGGTADSVSTVRGDIVVRGKVGGDAESSMGDIEIYAPVGGSVESDFGNVIVDAPIGGDLDVGHGEVEWGPRGRVGGDFYCPNCQMDRVSDANVGGRMQFGMSPGFDTAFDRSRVPGLVGWVFATLVFVAISVLAVVLVPRPIEFSARKIDESVGRSLLVGLAFVPAALLLAVVLGVSIIGIPLLVLAAPAFLAFVFFGSVVTAYFIGRRILFATGRYHGGNAMAATIGAVVLSAAYLIPFLGTLIIYALALLGTGGAILALVSRRGTTNYSSYETYVGERRV
ncbi:hypothetical protein BH23ACT11_BH23ACT11_14290 [soil metagenome]